MKKKIKNFSTRGILEELEIAIFEGTLDEANEICDQYNLRIIEIEYCDSIKTFTIGDNDYYVKNNGQSN